MPMPTTEADLAAAFRLIGLATDPADRARLLPVLPAVEAMRAQVRTPALPATAEPAIGFAAAPRA